MSSGVVALDEVLQGLRLGDNVVWQVDRLEDYAYFAQHFMDQSVKDGRQCVYVRFAPHPPVLAPDARIATIHVDPKPGFDVFSAIVHRIIEERGFKAFYVFDDLSTLVETWATDELLANFFQVTCPFLAELDTVAYFALERGRHAPSAVARIRDTTQLLLDLYHVDRQLYLHPIKVWDRYSPQMFLPHRVAPDVYRPVFRSGSAASVTSTARPRPLPLPRTSSAPWDTVYRRLVAWRESAAADDMTPEIAALKEEFSRMLLGEHAEFRSLADRYLTLDDLFRIRERLVGSGRIGGKATGMLLARAILERDTTALFGNVLEDHDSFYIGSDVFFTFLVNNDLFRLRLEFSRLEEHTVEGFAEVERRFLEGAFSPDILEQFRAVLDYFGQAPIIVRSSSLLEDSFGNAFAGKYRSEFCPNQGSPEARLEAFVHAVKLVYASALNPDALAYRRRRGLDRSDEQMAILVQRVSGHPHGRFFFPMLAGVAFSHNLYVWTDRIDPDQGVIRLVFGLGTRAVNRVGGDYPRLIAVSDPELRPEVGAMVAKYSQREIDVLDLVDNSLRTVGLREIVEEGQFHGLHLLVSENADGLIADPVTRFVDADPDRLVLTFNNLIRRTSLVPTLGAMLHRIEAAYGRPVDTEFTATVEATGHIHINLLQCRPMMVPTVSEQVKLPEDLPPGRVLFRAHRVMNGGAVEGIRYLLYIDPRWYAALPLDKKSGLGRTVGRINRHPEIQAGKLIMIGPGRWGSSNIELGVNVTYADIDHAAVLVEMAREEAGQVPEVSHGTHFFLDLVEGHIIYMPIYPDDRASSFNADFFDRAPNVLGRLLPECASFSEWVRLIDVPQAAMGWHACVVADPATRSALCYLSGAP